MANGDGDSIWLQFSDAVQKSTNEIYRTGTTSGLLVNLAPDSTATSINGFGWQNGTDWLTQTPRYMVATLNPVVVTLREMSWADAGMLASFIKV